MSATRSTLSEAQNNVIMWLFKQAGSFAEGDTLTDAQETLMQRLLEDGVITNKQALAIEAHVTGEEPVIVENTPEDEETLDAAKQQVEEEEEHEVIVEPKPKKAKSEYMIFKEARVADLVEGGMNKREAGRQAKAEWQTALKNAKEAKKTEKAEKKQTKKRGQTEFQRLKMEFKRLYLEANPDATKKEAGQAATEAWKDERTIENWSTSAKKNPDIAAKWEAIFATFA